MSEETSGLVAHAHEIVNKLRKLPQLNEKLKNIVQDLSDLANDLDIIVKRAFTSEWEYNNFTLRFDWSDGAYIETPYSKLDVGFINIQCLKAKSVYECLKEQFSNKQSMLEKILKEFSEALDKYVETLKEVLTEEDP